MLNHDVRKLLRNGGSIETASKDGDSRGGSNNGYELRVAIIK